MLEPVSGCGGWSAGRECCPEHLQQHVFWGMADQENSPGLAPTQQAGTRRLGGGGCLLLQAGSGGADEEVMHQWAVAEPPAVGALLAPEVLPQLLPCAVP